MAIETRQVIRGTHKDYLRVDTLTTPGKYRFAHRPELSLSGGHLLPESPSALVNPLLDNLKTNFPEIWSAHFSKAHFDEDKGILYPALINFSPTWEHPSWMDQDIIGYGAEIYTFSYGGTSSGGGGDNSFYLEDKGNMNVDRNKLTFAPPINRDGSFRLSTAGVYESRHEWTHVGWSGALTLEGEKPGTLIRSTIELVNQITKEKDYPLWKELPRDKE
jgi:hypothetical protein